MVENRPETSTEPMRYYLVIRCGRILEKGEEGETDKVIPLGAKPSFEQTPLGSVNHELRCLLHPAMTRIFETTKLISHPSHSVVVAIPEYLKKGLVPTVEAQKAADEKFKSYGKYLKELKSKTLKEAKAKTEKPAGKKGKKKVKKGRK